MKLALIGDPVEHSRSPEIHRRLLRGEGIDGSYEAIRVRAGEAAEALTGLRQTGYTGCNVTSPLKEEAARACDVLSPGARRIGAVNTIAFGERTIGTNTDGIGAAIVLRELLGSLEGRVAVVLGTGPTARAAVAQLVDERARVLLWGRDESKVCAIVREFGAAPWRAERLVPNAAFSALAPAAVLSPELVRLLSRVDIVVDANYGERSTLGAQLEVPVIDGSAMLEAQARASFDFWLSGKATGRTLGM